MAPKSFFKRIFVFIGTGLDGHQPSCLSSSWPIWRKLKVSCEACIAELHHDLPEALSAAKLELDAAALD
jgi:hypothetical protein